MFWIALQPSHEDEMQAWGWRCLQFSPRVCRLEEALLVEVSTCERLWGGRRNLLRKLFRSAGELTAPAWACASTSVVAMGLLRLKRAGETVPEDVPGDLPLKFLSAAREHLQTLERIGCTRWGQLRSLPRQGVSRRFGSGVLKAIDAAWGQAPEQYEWLQLPQEFDVRFELVSLATTAVEMTAAAQKMLSWMQLWLQARNRGVTAFELEWTLDLRKLDGKVLPSSEKVEIRTAQPTQEVAHLMRLVSEQLVRTPMSAPANHLRLRSLETLPWGGLTTSLLPEDNRPGEPLHQFIERLSTRLGENNVRVGESLSDHRPEKMQRWIPARSGMPSESPVTGDALYPTWLLPRPLKLEMKGGRPWHGGPLRRLTRLYRIETAWWEETGAALRDYFIARSDEAGLVWIYRERSLHQESGLRREQWYLQGLYA